MAMLAATSLGAVWSSCSPDFGVQGVLDRFGQIEPRGAVRRRRLLVQRQGRCRSSTRWPRSSTACPRSSASSSCRTSSSRGRVRRTCRASARRSAGMSSSARTRRAPIEYARLPFDHPLYILYSSGTTGVPKCIVHGAGGTLLQHLKEHRLHGDIKPGRPAVLFHDLRLDDVELARLRPRLGRDAAPLRRVAVHRPRQGAVGFRRCRAGHALRHVGEVHRPREEDRRRSVQGFRARAPARRCSRRGVRWRPRASTTSTSA